MQPTLGVPPLSTLYGLLSAACGRIVPPQETAIGYVAPFVGKATDLERIHAVGEGARFEGTNVIKRDLVFEPQLFLYLTNLDFENALRHPRYPLLLGRSCDLAQMVSVRTVKLEAVDEAEFQFTILPFPWEGVASPILALPIAFGEDIPRRPIAVRPYHILEGRPQRVRANGRWGQILRDPEKGWGVYLHAVGQITGNTS
jgi:CRISPR-associated protein Cas5t